MVVGPPDRTDLDNFATSPHQYKPLLSETHRKMRVLIIGFGSIGIKHARSLSNLGQDVAVVSRRAVDWPKVYGSIPQAIADWAPQYVVIASRTSEHWADLKALIACLFTGTVLIEKPVFDHQIDLPENNFSNIFIGYNLRLHPLLVRMKALLSRATIFAVHAYVGSDLTRWRPQIDYRDSNSAHRKEGGGVLKDLSHELDYLNWMFGQWRHLTASGGHVSALEIDSDDVFSILYKTDRCPVITIQMNYLDSPPRREFVALTDTGTVRADLIAGTLDVAGKYEYFGAVIQDTYTKQHQAVIDGNTSNLCGIDDGLEIMQMIHAAEQASSQKIWVMR